MLLALAVLGHFIGDFILQSRHTAENKSSNLLVLFEHCLIIWVTQVPVSIFLALTENTYTLLPPILNAIAHGVIDWYIWRGYKLLAYRKIKRETLEWAKKRCVETGISDIERLSSTMLPHNLRTFEYWKDKTFYTFIGLDQTLHILTLIVVWSMVGV